MTEESEDGPIGRTMFRSRHLTPKHSHLMAEHDDLDRQIGVATSRETEELERAYEGDLEERESHGPFSRDPTPWRKSQVSEVDASLDTHTSQHQMLGPSALS